MTTLGQPAEASCPSGKVVPAGGAVVVDAAVAMTVTMTPANPHKRKLMPVPILKPEDTIEEITAPSAQPRNPDIGSL